MNKVENTSVIASEILNTCGGTKYLHIGSREGEIVQELLSMGMDAYGLDSSEENVTMCNATMPNRFSVGNAYKLPYADQSFDTTIALYNLEQMNDEQLISAIKEIRRVTRRSIYLRIETTTAAENEQRATVLDRNGWEKLFFEEGFRKHPSYYLINSYEGLARESGEAIILLETISQNGLKRYPLEALKKERDLHMDMTRETGERSDAHIVRYQWAATFVRPGDTVLDAACGLGYGSYLIQCGTMAAKTMGIDGSNYAIDYANTNFSPMVKGLSFSQGMLPEALASIPDNSVDVAISFETLEHIDEPETVLAEFHRILTPAGRVIVSVPNDWSDETGEDPNPYHFHVYTLDKLRNQINSRFVLENVSAQSATHYKNGPGSKEWVPAKRELYSIPTGIEENAAPKSEWWLAVGMKSTTNAENVPYCEKQYKTYDHKEWNVTAFSRDYKNPWLVRAMVDINYRQKNKTQLKLLTEQVYELNRDNSADTGAALCVFGYQLLNEIKSVTQDELDSFSSRVNQYTESKPETPHAIRWMVSLHFVLAKLWLKTGMHDKALASFENCVSIDPLEFSPLLANRVIEAYLYLGVLSLNAGNKAAAAEYWRTGISSAQRAIFSDWRQSLGDINDPVEFGLPELSSILDYASNCAYALVNIENFNDKPWWWLQLNRSPYAQAASLKKTFLLLGAQMESLSAYADSLEKENHHFGLLSEEITTLKKILASLYGLLSQEPNKENSLDEYISAMNARIMHLEHIQDENAGLLKIISAKDSTINSLTSVNTTQNTMLAELSNTLQLKDQAIDEQATAIHSLNLKLNEYSDTLKLKDEAIDEQAAAIHTLNLKLEEYVETLKLKDLAINEQAAAIHSLNLMFEELSNTLQLKDQAIGEQATAIHSLNLKHEEILDTLQLKDLAIEEQSLAIHNLNLTLEENSNTLQLKDQVIEEQATAIHSLNLKQEELLNTLQLKDLAIEEQSATIHNLNLTLGEYSDTLQLKDEAIAEQTAAINGLNAIMQTRLMRLRNVLLNQPWSTRKVMHITYLTASLLTPRPIRRKISPAAVYLRRRFAHKPLALPELVNISDDNEAQHPASGGYKVKVPKTKAGAPKIAHVIANFMTGGSSRLVVDLVEYLGDDYEQFILTSFLPQPPAYIGLTIEEHRDCHDILPFIEYFKRKQPDFVHVHYWGDVDEPWYAQAIEAANRLHIPVIENINTPIVPHMSDAVKRYVYVSDYVRHVFGLPDNSHVTVYPGSDFSHFMRDENDTVPEDCVGMVYRLERDKLNEEAIKPFISIALKRPQTKILIVGGGSLLEPFQQAVKEAGVEDNFEFTGYVEYDTLPDYYRRMSIFVAPVWKESFGQVSPFAMNMRVPVIGYDVGAISEIVNSKDMLAPAGDAEKLADIAVELLNDDRLRTRMGREHQQRAESNFSVQAMISAYAGLYDEMMEK